MLISTSFLSSINPSKDLKKLNDTDTDFIHVDVMDGIFVQGRTMPFKEMRKIYKYTSKRLDVHLMVEDPAKLIKKYATLNAEYISIHVESENVEENLKLIKSYAIKSGIAINPETKVKEIVPYLPLVDMVLVMSVEPGKGGQAFIPNTQKKIKEVAKLLKEYKSDALISVDGGINNETKALCDKASVLVAGTYIISDSNFQERINKLR